MSKQRVLMAREDDDQYGMLRALVRLKRGKLVGERYDGVGRKLIAVSTAARIFHKNPLERGTVRIGREFFTSALRDYDDWKEKWWREAIQNAVDAGATKVDCVVKEDIDKNNVVICSDNGRGMDEDTLLNKFLVLGATTKRQVGRTTGGFGKAKELLILPWISWEIRSRDLIVLGQGVDYEVRRGPAITGTKLTVLMPEDETTHASAASAFISKCYLPGVRFTVDGEKARPNLRPGELVREFEGANLFYDKKKEVFRSSMLVRSNGLFMFSKWISEGIGGQLVLELTAPSIKVLTANRDGFRSWDLRREIDQFTNQLAKDVKTALKAKKGMIRRKFTGRGKFEAASEDELSSLLFETLGHIEPDKHARGKDELSKNQITEIVQVIDEAGGGWQPEREIPQGAPGEMDAQDAPPINMRATGELASAMLAGLSLRGAAQIEAMIQQLAWEPDFFLVNEVEGWRVPRKFFPDKMAPGVRKLLRFWAELCRFVLIQLGSTAKFGVGYIFAEDTGAAYIKEGEHEHWLMLNPFALADKAFSSTSMQDRRLLSPSQKTDVPWLYAAAVHECTHMADGITYHDESFATAFTRNVAATSGKSRQIEKIRKAVISTIAAEGRTKKKRKVAQKLTLPERLIFEELAPTVDGLSFSTLFEAVQWASDYKHDVKIPTWELRQVLHDLHRRGLISGAKPGEQVRLTHAGAEVWLEAKAV